MMSAHATPAWRSSQTVTEKSCPSKASAISRARSVRRPQMRTAFIGRTSAWLSMTWGASSPVPTMRRRSASGRARYFAARADAAPVRPQCQLVPVEHGQRGAHISVKQHVAGVNRRQAAIALSAKTVTSFTPMAPLARQPGIRSRDFPAVVPPRSYRWRTGVAQSAANALSRRSINVRRGRRAAIAARSRCSNGSPFLNCADVRMIRRVLSRWHPADPWGYP